MRRVAIVMVLAACGKSDESLEVSSEPGAEVVADDAIDIRKLELDTAPAGGAEPGDWVRCARGAVVAAAGTPEERRFEACRDAPQTWVDPAKDRVAFIVEAANVARVTIAGKRGRMIDQRARVEVDLRPHYARVPANEVLPETIIRLHVAIEDERGRVAEGKLELETPRVLTLLASAAEKGLLFPGEEMKPLPAKPEEAAVIVLGPGAASVVSAPEVRLDAIDVIAFDRGKRPMELTVVERRTGKVLGEKRWPGEPTTEAPDVDALRAGIEEVLEGRDRQAVALGFDPALAPPFDPEMIRRLATFLGVGPETTRDGLVRVFGRPTGVTPSDGGIETHEFGPAIGALVDAKTGKAIELWVVGEVGREALKKMKLDDPLLAHIGRSLGEVVKALGRPTKIGDGFVSWTVEGETTIYLEMQCAKPEGGAALVCDELDVGWLKE